MSTITPTIDPEFTKFHKSIPVDTSSTSRQSIKLTAQDGSQTTRTSGLNIEKRTTRFMFNNMANSRLRLNSSVVCFKCHCTDSTGSANMTTACVPWNVIAHQIDNIALYINNSSIPIYKSSAGTYASEYASRLYSSYDWNHINNEMDEQLYGPIELSQRADTYTSATSYDEDEDEYTTTTTSTITHAQPLYTIATATAFNHTQAERIARHNTSNYQKNQTKMIPICDLIPTLPTGIINQLRSFMLEITYRDKSTELETLNGDAGSIFHITECYMLLDMINMTQEQQKIEEANKQVPNIIPYLTTQCFQMKYNKDTDIVIGSQKNIMAVMVMHPAVGEENSVSDREATSTGQTMLFNCSHATTAFLRDSTETGTTNQIIERVNIQYGNITYPTIPIQTVDMLSDGTKSPNLAELYHYYLIALNSLGNKLIKPIPFNIFSTTQPFIFLKPYSNNAGHLTKTSDLIIQMRGGADSLCNVILYKLVILKIESDGSIIMEY